MNSRYDRQMILPEIGAEGQRRLKEARVLVIGAGGLGCPVLQYLTAAGTGFIRMVDADTVAWTNLHRQVLYGTEDVGRPKVVVAKEVLSRMNGEVEIEALQVFATPDNVFELMDDIDIVVDATDNIPTRYLVNDAGVLSGIPVVYGAIHRFEGQVTVFNYKGSAHYRDLFPEPPREGEIPDCQTAGVLGVLPGIVGAYQAAEVLKIITRSGEVLANRLLFIDIWKQRHHVFEYHPAAPGHPSLPATREALQAQDYRQNCLTPANGRTVDKEAFCTLLEEKHIVFLDVRQPEELPRWTDDRVLSIPLDRLRAEKQLLPKDKKIVTFCQTGIRSRQALPLLDDFIPRENLAYIPFSIHQILAYVTQMDRR